MAESNTAATIKPKPKPKRDRSPSFPFIPLKTAIERLEAFEKHFGRHPTPANRAGAAWGMKEQSSQADQTMAALRSYGLVTYDGMGPKRTVSISEEGRKYLRAQQEGVKEAVRKQSALRPKIIRKFWAQWGEDRPVDAVALDILILENAFSDKGARDFLKVYDETVTYAKLSMADKVPETEVDEGGEDQSSEAEAVPAPKPKETLAQTFRHISQGKVNLMAGERELTAGLLSKESNFRLLVSGPVGVKEIERLIAKLELDKEILAEPDPGGDEG